MRSLTVKVVPNYDNNNNNDTKISSEMELALHYTLLTPFFVVYTSYTIQTALHCLNSSKYAYDKVSDVLES